MNTKTTKRVVREASPQTKALCGDHLPHVQALADRLNVSRATVVRSIIADFFAKNQDAAALAVPTEEEHIPSRCEACLAGCLFCGTKTDVNDFPKEEFGAVNLGSAPSHNGGKFRSCAHCFAVEVCGGYPEDYTNV